MVKNKIRELEAGFRSVHWPAPVAAAKRTGMVLAVSVVAGVLITAVDTAAGQAVNLILNLF